MLGLIRGFIAEVGRNLNQVSQVERAVKINELLASTLSAPDKIFTLGLLELFIGEALSAC
jgi:hypothetical protein